MEDSSPDPALEPLEALVGEWEMEAGPPDGPPWPGEARVAFEWLEGRRFLIQRWSIDLPEAPNGIAIIGLRDAPASAEAVAEAVADSDAPYRQHYFDSRGVHRIYEMTLRDGEEAVARLTRPVRAAVHGPLQRRRQDDNRRLGVGRGRLELEDRLRATYTKLG